MTNLVKGDNALMRYLRETRAEIAKVAWPTPEETRNLSLIVIGVTVAMSVALSVFDAVFAEGVKLIFRLFNIGAQ